MKFNKYLTESSNTTIKEVLTTIYDNCQPFLKDLTQGGFNYHKRSDKLLYSGRNDNKDIFKKSVRANRRPKDMTISIQEMWDNLFYEKFKVKPRSNAIFCSGDLNTALFYGTRVYMIFPVRKYTPVWSGRVSDLYSDEMIDKIMSNAQTELSYGVKEIGMQGLDTKEVDKRVRELTLKINKERDGRLKDEVIKYYQDDKLVGAIRSYNEIMLVTNEYIAVNNKPFNQYIRSYIDIYKMNKPTDKNLDQWWEHYGGYIKNTGVKLR